MKACIKINDRVGLTDFMSLLGARALRSEWVGHDVWTVQEGDDGRFEDLCDGKRRITGVDFAAALRPVIQIIDGRFEGFEDGRKDPWVIIESIDSSFHLLHADDDVLNSARTRFVGIANYDPPAVPWKRRRVEPNQPPEPAQG
jgi:hypothetical protein